MSKTTNNVLNLFTRIPSIWEVFFLSFVFLYFIPSILIFLSIGNGKFLTEQVNLYLSGFIIPPEVSSKYILGSFLFLLGYILPLLYWSLLSPLPVFQTKKEKIKQLSKILQYKFFPIDNLFYYFVIIISFIGCLIVLLYFLH